MLMLSGWVLLIIGFLISGGVGLIVGLCGGWMIFRGTAE